MKPFVNVKRADDLVHLVFVTQHNHLGAWNVLRSEASENIKSWFDAREVIRNKSEGWEDAENWLKHATFAYNGALESGGTWSSWAVAWEHVIGLYVNEIDSVEKDLYRRDVEAREKMAKLAEYVESDRRKGDSWQSDSDDDSA